MQMSMSITISGVAVSIITHKTASGNKLFAKSEISKHIVSSSTVLKNGKP